MNREVRGNMEDNAAILQYMIQDKVNQAQANQLKEEAKLMEIKQDIKRIHRELIVEEATYLSSLLKELDR